MLRLAAAVLGVLVVGCGGSSPDHAADRRAAPYAAIDARANRAVDVTPALLRAPIARYRRHIRRELGAMLADVRSLRRAIADGDLTRARTAWLRADARYGTIGAAYGAFGDLDAAINGTPGNLRGGPASSRFTGLHRVELALWGRRSTRDAARPAARLVRDVARLRARARTVAIEPLDLSLRVHEILEDTLHLSLSGRQSPWAGAALTAVDANVAGTRVLLRELGPIAAQSDAAAVALSWRALDRLQRAVDALRRRGRLPRWDALALRARERIAGLTAAAAERLAYLPGLVDPRPPLPPQPPIEARR